MAVKIRLLRVGKKKQPSYRLVVADSRSPRNGRIIEKIGRYSPLDDPSVIDVDDDRALHWLRTGAQPTEAAQKILETAGVWAQFAGERPGADTAARRAIEHHKVALANRPEAEPEPDAALAEAEAAGPAADDQPGDDEAGEPAGETPPASAADEEPAGEEPADKEPPAEERADEEPADEETSG